MGMTRIGALAALAGVLLIFVGLFSGIGGCYVPGAPCPSPSAGEISAYLGIVVLVFGFVVLVRSSWRGSLASSAFAAVAIIPATWTLYEIARQDGCPLLADPAVVSTCLAAYGEMTAPVLSFGVGVVVLLVGFLRWRGLRKRAVPVRPVE